MASMDKMIQTRDGVTYVDNYPSSRDPEEKRRQPSEVAHDVSQDYEAIRRKCLAPNDPWEDLDFPATDDSINPKSRNYGTIEWLRPKDICKDPRGPRMSVDGFTRFDVKQGFLGNCWFLAATASLCSARNKELFHRVVPQDNSFSEGYAGVFRFRLWQNGKWVDVVVDDRLPTKEGRLIFARSATDNEFWPALLEKAYAKLHGSYQALVSGSTLEAMQDFTGGVTEIFNFEKDIPENLFTLMMKAFEWDSLMCGSVAPKNKEEVLSSGLSGRHAYSITSVKQVTTIRGDNVNLIRLRNPWANQSEWKGPWSDKSPEWKNLSEADKKSLDLNIQEDGEFWMSYEKLISNFSGVEMCTTVPTFDALKTNAGSKKQWEVKSYDGFWKRSFNAGGCRNHVDTFCKNPKYKVQVVDPDEGDDGKTGTLIVALMQKDRRKKMAGMLFIGYYIYKIPETEVGPQDENFFLRYNRVEGAPVRSNVRERVGRHELPPGSYLIIPCTDGPDEEGEFLLRIFSEKPITFEEIDKGTWSMNKRDE